MKKLLTIIILLFINQNYSQNTFENNTIKIEYLSSKKVSNRLHLNSSTRISSKEIQKISIKCKFKSLNKERIDINKISLLDIKNKIRYRPTDISYQPIFGYMGYGKLMKVDLKKKGLIGYHNLGAYYKPEIKDTFEDYEFKGYTNFALSYNFWTEKKPLIGKVYFAPHKFKKFKSLIFFPILNKVENPEFELYYGNERISKIKDLKL